MEDWLTASDLHDQLNQGPAVVVWVCLEELQGFNDHLGEQLVRYSVAYFFPFGLRYVVEVQSGQFDAVVEKVKPVVLFAEDAVN